MLLKKIYLIEPLRFVSSLAVIIYHYEFFFFRANDFNLLKISEENFNILLESSQLSQDEVVARYVLNLMNIKDIIIENKDKLSKSLFILKICQKYPFLSSLDGRQFFYVAEGIMPSNN